MKAPILFLDLDDTILDFHWAERRALTRTFREAGLEPDEEVLDRYSDINRSQWELLELGKLSREQVLVRRFALLFTEHGIRADAESIGRRYEELLADGSPVRWSFWRACAAERVCFWPPTAARRSRSPEFAARASERILRISLSLS